HPSYTEKTITFANGTTPMGNGTWIKSNTKMDWWSAQDFCASLGKEMITRATIGTTQCNNNPTARRIYNGLNLFVGNGYSGFLWLENRSQCSFYCVRSYKADVRNPEYQNTMNYTSFAMCQPVGYTEPDPICPNNQYYDVATDRCACTPTTCDCFDGSCTNSCTKVDYLESTGSQYIDTGWTIDWSKDISITGSFALPTTGKRLCIIGGYSASNELNIEVSTNNKFRLYEFSGAVDKTSSSALSASTVYPLTYTYNASTGATNLSVSNVSVSATKASTASSANTERLFADNRGTGTFQALRIYGISISNGSFARDFIPVITRCNNEPAMYDQVTKTLFYNEGSGEFVTP
ncbi:MAG: hypothetical protein J6Y85_02980, partial [Alphaproteobacteria bacterium]|nr:hypothetical protein [Alphaproteobacteria bacterium]